MSVSFMFVDPVLHVNVGGKILSFSPEHPMYKKVRGSLKDITEKELLELYENGHNMTAYTKGLATLEGETVMLNGVAVHNTIATRIRQFMLDNLPFENLLRFLENINLNPSMASRNELYDFLENKHLPITEDGYFLAYKAIKSDWTDKWTGKINNSIGAKPSMPRPEVDDDRTHECSYGYHAGGLDYVRGYAGPDDIIVIVKINPKDVVSVPQDCSFQKLRCCEYEVLRVFENALDQPLYKANADSYPTTAVDNDDLEWAERHYSTRDNDDWDDDYDDDVYDEDYIDDSWVDDDYEDESDIYNEDEDEDFTSSLDGFGRNLGTKPYYNKRDQRGRFTR